MFTRGTAFADIRISGIIPQEIIFWYREIINFSVSGIDFSSLHREITACSFRPALWRARPNVPLALPPVSLISVREMELWNFYMCKPYINENCDAWILVHNLCKDIWKMDGRTDGQTHATTIPLCPNWPGVIKTQMTFHNYQSGLLFVCIDANVFAIDSWPNALGHDDCDHNFSQLCRSAWARWLIKSPNLGNRSHIKGEVTANMWADTHTVSGKSSLKMICTAIMTYLCQRLVPLSNTIPQYMYSSNIIDMPHMFSPRFVTQIFVVDKKLLLCVIMCVFIRLY